MDKVECTTQELADALGVPKEAAYALIQYLEKATLITRGAPRPTANGKGKGSIVYAIPKIVGQRLKEDLDAALQKIKP